MLSDSSIRYQASITEGDRGGVGGHNYSFQALGNVASVMPTLQGSDKSGEGLEPTTTPACKSVLNHSKLDGPVPEIQHHM